MAVTKSFREFTDLIGEEISAVSFVRDYVEFHFDGPVLRALCGPTIEFNGAKYEFPEAGSRDVLCSMIDSTVENVEFVRDHHFGLWTSCGHRLTIPLNPDPPVDHECLNFTTPDPRNSQYW